MVIVDGSSILFEEDVCIAQICVGASLGLNVALGLCDFEPFFVAFDRRLKRAKSEHKMEMLE